MNTAPIPSELVTIAITLYDIDHPPGAPEDDLSFEEYFDDAYRLLVSAREFIAAREREGGKT